MSLLILGRLIKLVGIYLMPISLVVLLFTACNSLSNEQIVGLWELREVKIDEFKRVFSPTFMEINGNNSFAVSKRSGDIAGTYNLSSKMLSMKSVDPVWFNTTWKINYANDCIYFQGKDVLHRNTKLVFQRIQEVPSFEEFEEKIVGNWQLYKVTKDRVTESLPNTWLNIDNQGNYSLVSNDGHEEYGKAIINPRHRKIFFEHDQTEWRTWFFGHELRLTNDQMNVQYRLRRAG